MATDTFLKLGDVKGESTDDKHRDEIEVLAFSWGMSQPGSMSGGGGSAGKVTFQDLHCKHSLDKASPNIMKTHGNHPYLCSAEHRYDYVKLGAM